MKKGWIKLERKTVLTDWYTNIPAKVLAIHLLLRVNETSNEWHGITIERGSLVTSRAHLSEETGLTQYEVRTALRVLTDSGFCSIKSTNQASIITVINWNKYQQKRIKNDFANDLTNDLTNGFANAKNGENPEQTAAEGIISVGENSDFANDLTNETANDFATIKEYKEDIIIVDDNSARAREGFIDVNEIPDLLDDEQYLLSVAYGKYITVERVRELIPEFVNQLIASGETKKDVADVKRHFNNWIRRRADIERGERMKQTNAQNQNGNNNRSSNRRRGRGVASESESDTPRLHKPTNRGK